MSKNTENVHPIEIIIADFSGFCFGVERAINIVETEANKGGKAVTFGPIIHNPQVVEALEKKGVKPINSLEETVDADSVIIRSHGVEKSTLELISKKVSRVIDATCPFVLKAQRAAEDLSAKCDSVVIFGEELHPEVQSIISYTTGEYFVVTELEEAKKLPFRKKYGFLAQTTQNNEIFLKISDIIKYKCDSLVIVKTICNATNRRQKASALLAAKVDVMVVIGGKNSANTTRLYQLCKEICPQTFHIETVKELPTNVFRQVSRIGLTAGASTPGYLVQEVREYILRSADE